MNGARGRGPGRWEDWSVHPRPPLGLVTGATRTTTLPAAPRATLPGGYGAIAQGHGRRAGHLPRYNLHSQAGRS